MNIKCEDRTPKRPAFALPLVLLFTVRGSWFLSLAFGEAFTATALAIITGGQMINAAAGPVRLLLIMSGHENKATLSVGIGAGVNLLLNGVLIISLWVVGAVIAGGLTIIATNILAFYFAIITLKKISFTPSGGHS